MDSLKKRECLVIRGGQRLVGEVCLHGAKNAVLPILVAATLSDECVKIDDCPYISDVENMLKLLENLGVRVVREGRSVSIYGRARNVEVSEELSSVMRSSMYVLGALLANVGEVSMSYPGGCKIGTRGMDIHLCALERLGAECTFDDKRLYCKCNQLVGADIVLRYPSVGATQNALMCAVLAKGNSKIINAAREPEIVALAHALRIMGARIAGEGTPVIYVEGVEKLGGGEIVPISDRIILSTIMCAVGVCGGEVVVKNANLSHVGSLVEVLKYDGCQIESDALSVKISSKGQVGACSVTTGPYPLFATDVQPQLLATRCFANGVSRIRETVFESRFAYADQLKKLGAKIEIDGTVATLLGGSRLQGAPMYATDLRGGAGLCIAALRAEGESVLFNPHYIDRGYEQIENVFSSLGGDIRRDIRLPK